LPLEDNANCGTNTVSPFDPAATRAFFTGGGVYRATGYIPIELTIGSLLDSSSGDNGFRDLSKEIPGNSTTHFLTKLPGFFRL